MRAALAGLTTRGRSFLAAGIAACACALLLGEMDLMRVGLLLCLLPVLSCLAVARVRYRLSCTRRVEPARVQASDTAMVHVRLDNVSRLPSGVLLVEDRLPYTLGGRPRFVLNRVEPRGSREVAYPVRSDLRGRYTVGPMVVRLTDPFGLVELTRSFASTDAIIVTPSFTDLPIVKLGGEWSGGGDSLARAVATAGEDDVATREYRHGDDLRRVHWKATARYGELMVRREEQPWQSRGAILLDTRSRAHRGEGPGSSFEWAVSAAASIGVHLSRLGYDLRLVTDLGSEVTGHAGHAGSDGGPFEAVLLDSLAMVGSSAVKSLLSGVATLRKGGGQELVVAVLGDLSDEDLDQLGRFRHGSSSCVAVLLDTAAWSSSSPGHHRGGHAEASTFADRCRLLHTAGWRVLPASPRTDLRRLWTSSASGAQLGESLLTSSGGTS
jgi:uncharacterized protein (DUF58 family)